MRVGFLCTSTEQLPQRPRLYEEFVARGHDFLIIDPYAPGDLSGFDLFAYTMKEQSAALSTLVRDLRQSGRRVLQGSLAFRDKIGMHDLFSATNMPVPHTIICNGLDSALNAVAQIGYPLIGKGCAGGQGEGVRWLANESDLQQFIAFAHTIGPQFLLQEIIYPVGRDIRAFVVGDKVVAAMERFAADGDFRANYSLSGKAELTSLTAEEAQLAMDACKLSGLDYTGVDFIRSPNGPVLLEVNKYPAFSGIEKVSGVNVALQIVEFCEKWVHLS